MRRLIVLAGMATLVLVASVEAATLNKCVDPQGKVTYSNLPCRNAVEVRKVDIDPTPLPDPVRIQRVQAQPVTPAAPAMRAAPKAAAGSNESSSIRLETQRTPVGVNTTGKPAARASARQCDALTDKLGSVFDKMDQARRKGYSQEQMDAWNQEVKDIERKKQQSGCF